MINLSHFDLVFTKFIVHDARKTNLKYLLARAESRFKETYFSATIAF